MKPFQILVSMALSLIVVAAFGALAYYIGKRLREVYRDRPHHQFQRQLIMVGVVLLSILLSILLMPIGGQMRGQLLSLYGIILSATIALSSTTLVGNVMAGIMLRTVKSVKPGDYVRVGEFFGRVSEMDLLHTEIQTEERDLTTLPNIYMVTNPVRVMRTSGTILSVNVSLGYDVSRHKAESLLLKAAEECELESPFVQIRELGDYSVTYAVSGLLTELKQLIGKRRQLRAATIDALHTAGIEIASPTIMNTRAFGLDHEFVPGDEPIAAVVTDSVEPDSIVFDKAEQAESVANLREKYVNLKNKLEKCELAIKETKEGDRLDAATAEKANIESHMERLQKLIEKRDAEIKTDQ